MGAWFRAHPYLTVFGVLVITGQIASALAGPALLKAMKGPEPKKGGPR